MTRHQRSTLTQWGWPIGLALLTLFGLISALIGEGGIWWWLSWAALAVPLVVIVYHIRRSGGHGDARSRAR